MYRTAFNGGKMKNTSRLQIVAGFFYSKIEIALYKVDSGVTVKTSLHHLLNNEFN